jgi:alkylation response protein AidB-like acyl-CoA dehydrogenase
MTSTSDEEGTHVHEQGLNFRVSPEQQDFRESLRHFVDTKLPREFCREVEARSEFPRDLWEIIGSNGLNGVGIEEEYGGQGGGIIEQMIVAEELARNLGGLVWIWGTTAFAGSKAIGHYGTDEQKKTYLPRIAAGEMLFSIALTEPDGGTDVLGAMRTKATRTEGGWIVNGSKSWSTMTHVADMTLLIARTDPNPAKPSHGITAFLLDPKSEGVAATTIPKLGMRSLGSCEVQLDNVFIPEENMIGEEGRAWNMLSETLNAERIMVAAQCCGANEAILEDMVRYAKERHAFGKPIAQFQAVQHMIADAHIGLESSRMHTYKAGWLQAQGLPCGLEATTAKIVASENAVKAADDGIQILGGNGYALEYDMQRYWRDMRLYRIAPINNEMGRNFVAEQLGLPRSF